MNNTVIASARPGVWATYRRPGCTSEAVPGIGRPLDRSLLPPPLG